LIAFFGTVLVETGSCSGFSEMVAYEWVIRVLPAPFDLEDDTCFQLPVALPRLIFATYFANILF
jgi:hypothetical protein